MDQPHRVGRVERIGDLSHQGGDHPRLADVPPSIDHHIRPGV